MRRGGQRQIVAVVLYTVSHRDGAGWGWIMVSCVVGMFIVRANRRKIVMVGGGTIVRGEWWFLPSWEKLCIMCKIRMSSVSN